MDLQHQERGRVVRHGEAHVVREVGGRGGLGPGEHYRGVVLADLMMEALEHLTEKSTLCTRKQDERFIRNLSKEKKNLSDR